VEFYAKLQHNKPLLKNYIRRKSTSGVGLEKNKKRRRQTATTTGKSLWLRDEMFLHVFSFKHKGKAIPVTGCGGP
jgi:hypothetical protein